MAKLEVECFLVRVDDKTISARMRIRITALDRKAADAVTGLGGAHCDLYFLSSQAAHLSVNVE